MKTKSEYETNGTHYNKKLKKLSKMKEDTKTILLVIEQYLEKNPTDRFTQALFNLGITEFADKGNPETKGFLLRDIYNDEDIDVLGRMAKQNGA